MDQNIKHLYLAASKGNWDRVKKLIKQGLDPKVCDAKGRSLLWHVANGEADYTIAKWLIDEKVPCKGDAAGSPWLIYLYHGFKQRKEYGYAEYINKAFDNVADEILREKLYGHRLSLEGVFVVKSRVYQYSGLLTDVTFPEIGESIEQFFSLYKVDLDRPKRQAIIEAFKICDVNVSAEELYRRYNRGELVNIPTGWSDHATAIVLKKRSFLIKGNKGAGREKKSLQVYKIGKPKKLTKKMFQGLLSVYRAPCTKNEQKLRDQYQSKDFFKRGINRKLQLIYQRSMSLKTKRQKGGHCAWSSAAKLAFRADLFLLLYSEGRSVKATWKKVEIIFKNWRKWDREKAFATRH